MPSWLEFHKLSGRTKKMEVIAKNCIYSLSLMQEFKYERTEKYFRSINFVEQNEGLLVFGSLHGYVRGLR